MVEWTTNDSGPTYQGFRPRTSKVPLEPWAQISDISHRFRRGSPELGGRGFKDCKRSLTESSRGSTTGHVCQGLWTWHIFAASVEVCAASGGSTCWRNGSWAMSSLTASAWGEEPFVSCHNTWHMRCKPLTGIQCQTPLFILGMFFLGLAGGRAAPMC